MTIEEVKETISGVADEIRIPLLSEVQAKYDHLISRDFDPVAACYICLDFLKWRIDCEINKL